MDDIDPPCIVVSDEDWNYGPKKKKEGRKNPQVTKNASRRILKTSKRMSKSALHRKKANSSQKVFAQSCIPSKLPVISNSSDNAYLFSVVNLLEKLNYKYEIMPNFQMKENCFFLQDRFMKVFYNYYPEFICFDILCEVPAINHNVALLISLDTNGHCEIVSVGLVKTENLDGYAWFFDVFKKHNKFFNKVEFITCINDVEMKEMLAEAFPNKLILFSLFHSLKAFKKELSCLDPPLSDTDISIALQIFEQMFFISSETGYSELLKQLKQFPQIFSVFKKKWHAKKELWALGLQFSSRSFFKPLSSFLLSIRKKLKPLICSAESLQSLVKKLHFGIIRLQKEWFQQFTCLFPNPVTSTSNMQIIQKYSKYLTPHATELITEQLNIAKPIRNVQKMDQFSYKINEIPTVVSFNTCSCNFYTLLMLPCYHIFVVRDHLSLPLFFDSLKTSWVAKKYQNAFLDLHSLFVSEKSGIENSDLSNKFNHAFHASQELWYLTVCCSDDVSQQRLEIFRKILKAWRNNFKINIHISPEQNFSSNSLAQGIENIPTDYFRDIYGISINDILDSENEFSSVSLCTESENELC